MNLILFYLSLIFFTVLVIYKQRLGLLIILSLLPSFLLRTQIFNIPTTWLELAIYILVLVWFMRCLVNKNLFSTIRHTYKNYKILILGLGLWLLTAILATIASPDLRLSAGVLKGWWVDPIIFTWLLLVVTKNNQHIKYIFYSLLGGTVLLATYGLFEYIFGFGMQADGLLNSVFKPANYLAMLITPIIIIGLGLLLAVKDDQQTKLKVSLSLAISLVALYLTKSYGGLLGLGAGIFTLLLFIPDNKKRKKTIIAFIVLAIIGIGLISTQEKFQKIIRDNERNSLTTRLQIWEISTAVLKDNLWLGVGLGNFQQPYQAMAYSMYQPPLEWEVVKAHNLYLNTWLEMGLLGLLSLVYLLIIFSRAVSQAIPLLWSKQKSWWLLAGMIAAMVSILTHGLLDTPYFKNDLAILFLVILALPFMLNNINKTN